MSYRFVGYLPRTLFLSLVLAFAGLQLALGQGALKDCGPELASLGSTVNGQKAMLTICKIVEEKNIQSASGTPYRQIEISIGGTLEGYTLNDNSAYAQYFTDVPEYVLTQRGHVGPYVHGKATYQPTYKPDSGSGMTVFLPESADKWNGKLFTLAHGSGEYSPIGELLPRRAGQYNRFMGANAYAGLMIDKGYAVAYTRRLGGGGPGSTPGPGEVTLDNGTVLKDKFYDYHVGWMVSLIKFAKSFTESRLGAKVSRTYYYGHSGGTALMHLINYVPNANRDEKSGSRVVDGALADDPGGGLYFPIFPFQRVNIKEGGFSLKLDDRDHLVFDDAARKTFAYQIDIAHQAYGGHTYTWGAYIVNKRRNARLLLEKGMGGMTRTYEIASVSHSDAGAAKPDLRSGSLDLSGFYDALIDVLDRWVDRGVEAPPTRSDSYELGDRDKDGMIENPAIELPEIACPLGVYYEFSEGHPSIGLTGFTAFLREPRPAVNVDIRTIPPDFDKAWLEPLDSRGYLVDMNKDGIRDTRESIAQAWQRRATEGEKYGTLGPYENLTHGRYVSCVAQAASDLFKQRLLSESAVLDYIDKAEKSDIGIGVPESVPLVPDIVTSQTTRTR